MTDPVTIPDTEQSAEAPRVEVLEGRVRRLEEVVAALQDTRALEQRVVERVAAQVSHDANNGARQSAGLIIEAGRHLLPSAVGALSQGVNAAEAHAQAQAAPPARPWLLF